MWTEVQKTPKKSHAAPRNVFLKFYNITLKIWKAAQKSKKKSPAALSKIFPKFYNTPLKIWTGDPPKKIACGADNGGKNFCNTPALHEGCCKVYTPLDPIHPPFTPPHTSPQKYTSPLYIPPCTTGDVSIHHPKRGDVFNTSRGGDVFVHTVPITIAFMDRFYLYRAVFVVRS